MINVQKVKKGLGKCWKFFAAKPAQAASVTWTCAFCGARQYNSGNYPPPGYCPRNNNGPHDWRPNF